MKKVFFTLAVFAAATFLTVPPSQAAVEVEGHIIADPCVRNAQACIEIFLHPQVHIDIYKLGGEKVESIDVTSPDELAVQTGPSFNVKLTPDKYIFYIENKLNGQEAIFGPVKLDEEVKKVRMDFTTYNSYPNEKGVAGEKEICVTKTIVDGQTMVMKTHAGTHFQSGIECYLVSGSLQLRPTDRVGMRDELEGEAPIK